MIQVKLVLIILALHETFAYSSRNQYSELHAPPFPASRSCLHCICEASSDCDTRDHCVDVCGPFRIQRAYWIDAGRPTLHGESPDSDTAFANCAQDLYCAGLAVQEYMTRYNQDCNKDGKIDCEDYVMIHKVGGFGCPGTGTETGTGTGTLPEAYKQRYFKCQSLLKYWH